MPIQPGLKIVTSPYLVDTERIPLTLADSFFLWIERLCNEADIYYYWRKVKTTREVPSKKAIVIGDIIYMHPQALIDLKGAIGNADGDTSRDASIPFKTRL